MRSVHATSANLVTSGRVALALGAGSVAVLDGPRLVLAGLLATALATDLVDGRLARRTGTASAFGARLDLEADALLILVMSAIAAADVGGWVLGLGLVRYVFLGVQHVVPRLRAEPPPRPWCKVVAVLTGVALAVAAVQLAPVRVEQAVLALVAVLLAESFGHEAVDRWRAGAPSPVRAVALSGSRG